jgi:hypothetical protein
VVLGEADELAELLLIHEALFALIPEILADVHDVNCRHLPVLSALVAGQL